MRCASAPLLIRGDRFKDRPRGCDDVALDSYARCMTLLRMDHVGIVVDNLDGAIAFFVELGLELEVQMPVEGAWVDAVVGLEGVHVEIAMMKTPDGNSRLELTNFRSPTAVAPDRTAPNVLGIRRIMFAVEQIDDVVERLKAHGAELVGEIANYENLYRLCYIRGPEGIIVALAEQIGSTEAASAQLRHT